MLLKAHACPLSGVDPLRSQHTQAAVKRNKGVRLCEFDG
jgi:hypothetical protein